MKMFKKLNECSNSLIKYFLQVSNGNTRRERTTFFLNVCVSNRHLISIPLVAKVCRVCGEFALGANTPQRH